MAKIENVGIGKFIQNPRGRSHSAGVAISKVLQVSSNEGNSFRCFPVTSVNSGSVVLDKTKYVHIPIGTNVQEVTIT